MVERYAATLVQSDNLVALLVTAVCAIIACAFSICGVLLHMVLNRAVRKWDEGCKRLDEYEKHLAAVAAQTRQNAQHIEWIKSILPVKIIPSGIPDPFGS